MARIASRPLWLVATLVALPTLARTHQDPQPPPVFRSDVELVMVDAVVVDSDGLPVPGLTRDDFVVLEHGRAEGPVRPPGHLALRRQDALGHVAYVVGPVPGLSLVSS